MKFVRITLSKSEPFTIPFEQAQRLFASQEQIVLLQEGGEWSGQAINKAYIVCADRDLEKESQWRRENIKALPEESSAPLSKEEQERVDRLKEEIRKRFSKV